VKAKVSWREGERESAVFAGAEKQVLSGNEMFPQNSRLLTTHNSIKRTAHSTFGSHN